MGGDVVAAKYGGRSKEGHRVLRRKRRPSFPFVVQLSLPFSLSRDPSVSSCVERPFKLHLSISNIAQDVNLCPERERIVCWSSGLHRQQRGSSGGVSERERERESYRQWSEKSAEEGGREDGAREQEERRSFERRSHSHERRQQQRGTGNSFCRRIASSVKYSCLCRSAPQTRRSALPSPLDSREETTIRRKMELGSRVARQTVSGNSDWKRRYTRCLLI